MDQIVKKVVFYITFVALGVFWAEVVSTNIPFGLIIPPLYLVYGLLYVIFLDALMRYQVRDLRAWYLFGALVGIITETFVAKVIFYGTRPDTFRLFGVAPGPIAFIILFYHAYFSFLAPAYFARRILYMPFPVPQKRWADYAFFAVPIILFPVVNVKLVQEGFDITFFSSLVMLSAVILSLWVLLLRYVGEIRDVLLTARERMVVLILTGLANIYFLFNLTNEGHGHAPADFPIVPFIVICGVIAGLLTLIFKAITKNGEAAEPVPYDGRIINLRLYCAWMIWFIAFTAGLAMLLPSGAAAKLCLLALGLTGALIGTISFFVSVFGLLWACQKQGI